LQGKSVIFLFQHGGPTPAALARFRKMLLTTMQALDS